MTSPLTPPTERLSMREKLAYGCGDFASVLYWKTFMAYLLFFYTDVFGISAAAAGWMFLVSRVLDAVADPVMGLIADRTDSRWGKFRPFILWFCVPYAAVGVLTFTVPAFGETGKLVWAVVTYNLLLLLYTIINIPYTAMLGVLTPNASERTSLSSIKFIFAYAAGVIVSATLLPMVNFFGGGQDARGWQLAFVIYGLAFIGFFLVTFFGTRERVSPLPGVRPSVRDDLRDLVSNRPWLILLGTTLALVLFIATQGTAMTHYFKYYIGSQTVSLPFVGTRTYHFVELVSAFNTVGQAASLGGVFLLAPFTRWVGGKRRAFVILFLISLASAASYYFFQPHQLAAIFGAQVLMCVASGPLTPLLWSMFSDTADYGEWKHGRRATGLIFSASTMGLKIGWALGAASAGWLLTYVGFKANVDQTPETLRGLVLLVSLIPAAFGVIAVAALAFYPLTEEKVATIGAELAERRRVRDANVA